MYNTVNESLLSGVVLCIYLYGESRKISSSNIETAVGIACML